MTTEFLNIFKDLLNTYNNLPFLHLYLNTYYISVIFTTVQTHWGLSFSTFPTFILKRKIHYLLDILRNMIYIMIQYILSQFLQMCTNADNIFPDQMLATWPRKFIVLPQSDWWNPSRPQSGLEFQSGKKDNHTRSFLLLHKSSVE